jgi:23S rRNA (cytidine2498-2'-O)-methyltransferase
LNYSILIYCRAGFESEAASEILEKSKTLNIDGYVKAKANSAFLHFYPHDPQKIFYLWENLNIHNLIFSRQVLFCFSTLQNLPEKNRIEPIIAECEKLDKKYKEFIHHLFIEAPDTNEHKEVLNFCKKFSTPLQIALEKQNLLPKKNKTQKDEKEKSSDFSNELKYNLHLFFLESKNCAIALSLKKNASPNFMGIPRLKFPPQAPSRSTLKLEEAFLFFLTDHQRETLLKNGLQAVDLGASPGGWTFQFVSRNIFVTAVDNANMDKNLMDSGMVEHKKEDGFKYTPPKPVHWMVCDMVEKPSRIAKLVAHWAKFRYAQNFIFNLKLPMKKRLEEVLSCLSFLKEELSNIEGHYILECKQLYHDREEVTVWLKVLS